MFDINIEKIVNDLYSSIYSNIELYLPKIIGAIIIIIIGTIVSICIYRLIIFLFKKFKIVELIDKLSIDKETFDDIGSESKKKKKKNKQSNLSEKISQKIKIDQIVSKSVSYYIFLVFFRLSIVVIGISEVEKFLGDLLAYLPSLFIGFMIGFFGIRFANFMYDIVYHALDLTKQKTAKIIALGTKIIILFFTLMAVLSKIGIATEITDTILKGFIAMLTIAGGLAFGLGGKKIAEETLEGFRR